MRSMTTVPINIVFGGIGGIRSALRRLLDTRGVRFVVAAFPDSLANIASVQPRFVQPTNSRS